ncbi:MAG TPA: hypothetical protein PL115_04465 [Bacteroidales bacterium]|jgi:hypothetical protein|nr:hypothetical protein [Bacteroidales bacterium]HPB89359.1 hypothetical protein [Bacteroidales bacterium]HQN24059.1 hypothetical protein [Bacteroidales bacterium]HQP79102.1 hypothetical protein [Bacteroidales bacterium]
MRITFPAGRFALPALLFAVLLLSQNRAAAQYYTLGNDSASAKWSVIQGDTYKVIYPQQTDSLARRYLYLFEKLRHTNLTGLKIESPKMPIILHPYTTTSNATVVWAPKRMEIFTSPPATGGYAQNWETQLALHEGRHLGQMQHYTKGVFSFFNILFGEQSLALGIGFYPSVWLLEGDAVLNETDFSNAGRGRSGEFLIYYRTAFLQGDIRSYDHWRYGSYRHYAPNKYAFGYMLASMMRYSSGNYYATGDAMNIQVKRWWDFFGVWNTSFIRATGYTPRKHWRFLTPFMSEVWQKDYLSKGPYHIAEPLLAKEPRIYTDYTDIIPTKKGIIATKSGYHDSRTLVSIDSHGKERRIRPFAYTTSDIISDGDSTLIWAETVPDLRWELQNYSIIRSYNLNTGKIRDITSRTKYFNPALSADGQSLYVVEYPIGGGSRLVQLDKKEGHMTKSIPAPPGGQITEVAQIGNLLYALIITESGMGLYRTEVLKDDGIWYNEIPDQHKYIQNLTVNGKSLYFTSDLDGLVNSYIYHPDIKLMRKLTNSRFGAKYPYIDNDSGCLYWADFGLKGYHPVSAPLDSLDWRVADFDKPFVNSIAEHLSRQARLNTEPLSEEEDAALKARIDSIPAQKYKKLPHLLRIHSWAPFYANINRIMNMSYEHFYQLVSAGATVISQNDLSTATMQLGYSYHKGFHSGHLNFNYSGLYPVFEVAVDYNDRYRTNTTIEEVHHNLQSQITELDDEEPISGEIYPIRYTIDSTDIPSWDVSLRTYVPLNLSKSGWNSGLIPQLRYDFSNDKYSLFGHKSIYRHSLTYGVRYYKMLPNPKSRLFPKWGFGVELSGAYSYGPHNSSGNIAYVYTYGYLPGIFNNQGIKLSAAYQKQFNKRAFGYLPNLASMPRGFSSIVLMDYAKFTADYAIPIYLGDVTWPWLYYLKRLQIIPFGDFAINRASWHPQNGVIKPVDQKYLYSYGVDVLVNAHLLRIGSELSFGFRYARTSVGTNYWNALFSTGLF